jgi:competence protein ComGC
LKRRSAREKDLRLEEMMMVMMMIIIIIVIKMPGSNPGKCIECPD